MLNRLSFLKLTGATAIGAFVPRFVKSSTVTTATLPNGPFRFCLNTSTILAKSQAWLK
ncbi:MAG: hypothetical protein QM802_16080 [Agriterribacter sp.]